MLKRIVCFVVCFMMTIILYGCKNSIEEQDVSKIVIKADSTNSSLISKSLSSKTIEYYGYKDSLQKTKLTRKILEKYRKLKKTYEYEHSKYIEYRDYSNGVEITNIGYYDHKIKVPSYIKSKPVIKLGGDFNVYDNVDGNDYPISYFQYFNCFCNAFSEVIYIPETVKEIVEGTFDIDTLKMIEVSKDNPYYSSKDGILYDKSGKIKLCVPPSHHSRTEKK